MNTARARRGSPIPASLLARLRRHDPRDLIRASGLAANSVWRALASGDVHVGTHLALERACGALENEQKSA